MLKKTITYTDYNGVERTEDFHFHFSKAEIMEMELTATGGYSDMIQKIIDAQDVPTLIKLWKDFVLKAYGEKSPDGKRFIKNDEVREAFAQTEAYSDLFMKLALDADEAAKFVNGVMPANWDAEKAALTVKVAEKIGE